MTSFTLQQDRKVTATYIKEREALVRTRIVLLCNIVNPGDTVIDFCCGIGETARLLTTIFNHPTGSIMSFDRSAAAIEEAQRISPSGFFSCIDLTPEFMAGKSADAVLCQAAIHWIPNDLDFLVAALKCAKKRLYFSTTRESEAKEGTEMKKVGDGDEVPYFRRRYTKFEFLKLATAVIAKSGIDCNIIYFEMHDPWRKTWMNIILCRYGQALPQVAQTIDSGSLRLAD